MAANKRPKKQQKPCLHCGEPVDEKTRKYCSKECYDESRRKKLNCIACGKEFYRVKHRTGSKKAFCSLECRDDWGSTRTHRRCPECQEDKPAPLFVGSYCGECAPIVTRRRREMPETRFSNGKSMAKKLNRVWGITFGEFLDIIGMPCHYCGKPLGLTGKGMDRKDTKGHYVSENVVPCCNRCNTVKSDKFNYSQMLRLGELLKVFDVENEQMKIDVGLVVAECATISKKKA